MRPRVTIYPFSDTTYSTQLYQYNGFTDTGSSAKPISLQFEGTVSGAGTFSIEIEDSDGTLDAEQFIKGNRVFIEMSKDGSSWQPAFKGVVRSCERYLYGAKGSNFTIHGYSYLVRFNERIVNVIKQSALVGGGTDYNRTDSTMFTDNLINDLLTNDVNYIYGNDDTQQYSLFKTTNITSSPVDNWIPRLDAQLVTISDAINSVLEFGNGVITIDPANDQLVLFDPQQVTTGTGVFLVTDQPNLVADNAAYTMYPVEPYKYTVSYDYPDSGSRLIASIGSVQCPETVISTPVSGGTGLLGFIPGSPNLENLAFWSGTYGNIGLAALMRPTTATITKIRVGGATFGSVTNSTNTLNMRLWHWTGGSTIGVQLGAQFNLYINGVSGTALPQGSGSGVVTAPYAWETPTGFSFTAHEVNAWNWFLASPVSTVTQSSGNAMVIGWPAPKYTRYFAMQLVNPPINPFVIHTETAGSDPCFSMDFGAPPTQQTTTIPPCGGLPQLKDAAALFAVAQDKNMSARLGVVERVLSDLPSHIRTKQTMDEYMFSKIFTASKPRFTFDYPAVTVPNIVPKAGDICAHVAKKANVGTKRSPLQVGVILSVNYDFNQDDEGAFSLTKMGLSTTGIRRGYY